MKAIASSTSPFTIRLLFKRESLNISSAIQTTNLHRYLLEAMKMEKESLRAAMRNMEIPVDFDKCIQLVIKVKLFKLRKRQNLDNQRIGVG